MWRQPGIIKMIQIASVLLAIACILPLACVAPTNIEEKNSSGIHNDLNQQIKRLYDPNANEGAYGTYHSEGMNQRAVIELLTVALKDKDWQVRQNAVELLGELEDPQAVESLITALKDRDLRIRNSTADALGRMGNLRAIQPLISALDETLMSDTDHLLLSIGLGVFVGRTWKQPELYGVTLQSIERALQKLTGKSFGIDIDKWQDWYNKSHFQKLYSQ